ncbi:hypothetical protein [Dyella lutea]|uniref:Uncharacterized protein n=1 Tax=Dyella lutea TaxID=2950441 RepID=A0ABT1FFU1_9GAMM|nr:hypothetical protein [Dyella lutea]MCP1376010.1 hypothetical protein [Dyella lutea]
MASPKSDVRSSELAMRSLLVVQQFAEKDARFAMCEVVDELVARFGISRANAYRKVGQAIDVLAIHYDPDKTRFGDRISAGFFQRRLEDPSFHPGRQRA